MKKTVILTACMFLVTSAYAGEKIVVASAASAQTQSKPVVAKQAAAKASEKPGPSPGFFVSATRGPWNASTRR